MSGDEARHNAMECRDCDALGPIANTVVEAKRLASEAGWARNFNGAEFWRCPGCRRSPTGRDAVPLRVHFSSDGRFPSCGGGGINRHVTLTRVPDEVTCLACPRSAGMRFLAPSVAPEAEEDATT